MTTPQDRAALLKARENIRSGVSGIFNPLAEQKPTEMLQSIEAIKAINRDLGESPTLEQQISSISDRETAKIRAQIDAARAEGRTLGQQLYGEGSLGNVGTDTNLGRVSLSPADLSALRQATALAQSRATQGLTPEEEQILREQGLKTLSGQTQTALRQSRAQSSLNGMSGETRKAREANILAQNMRASNELTNQLRLQDAQMKSQNLATFGTLGAQLGQLGVTSRAADVTAQQSNIDAAFKERSLMSDQQKFNIALRQSERQGRLATEMANVGLAQATESMGIQKTLNMIALQDAQKAQQIMGGAQLEQAQKPNPEAPEGGGSAICTECHRQGYMTDSVFNGDKWAAKLFLAKEEISGYHLWAIPYVSLMKKCKLFTVIAAPIANAWAKHMNFLVGMSQKDSIFGHIVYTLALPLCRLLGKLRRVK